MSLIVAGIKDGKPLEKPVILEFKKNMVRFIKVERFVATKIWLVFFITCRSKIHKGEEARFCENIYLTKIHYNIGNH